ncbi:MAG: penicillin-binding protein [Polyangiaceae bacterium]|nr:penicillin-binding protein [Polyangiaceae bacterium]
MKCASSIDYLPQEQDARTNPRVHSPARWIHAAVPVAFAYAALGLVVPCPAQSEPPAELRVDLRRISYAPDGVHARLVDGTPARLTLDTELQRTANRLLARARPARGAIVALDARSGRVLVWAEREQIPRGHGAVLTEARSPAASVFKLVTAATLLESAHVQPSQVVCTSGGEHRIKLEHLHRPQSGVAECGPFATALGRSRNAVFAQLATRYLKPSQLLATGEALGFNGQVPFETEVPVGRLTVPDDELGFARAATGFKGSTLSPLGGAYLAYVVASGGQTVRLHIVESADDYHAPEHREILGRVLSPWTAAQLRRMMEVTVHSGTCLRAFTDDSGKRYLPGVSVAGKTGTLRVSSAGTTTSWFVGFAPSRHPRIVVSVMLDNGSLWRHKANELARDLLRAYFGQLRANRALSRAAAPSANRQDQQRKTAQR